MVSIWVSQSSGRTFSAESIPVKEGTIKIVTWTRTNQNHFTSVCKEKMIIVIIDVNSKEKMINSHNVDLWHAIRRIFTET